MRGALRTLKKRSQFLEAAAKGKKAVARSLLLQAMPLPHTDVEEDVISLGFTTSKKLGNAVIRNRIRRRLRAAAALVLPEHADRRHVYVLIGRQGAETTPFTQLTSDLLWALKKTASLRS